MDQYERLAQITAEAFEPHLGTPYRAFDPEGNTLEVTLVQVNRLRSRPGQKRAGFSLLFRGPRDVQMTQGTYRFEHPSMEPLEFFVVPVGPDEEGLCYEAIFN